MVPTEIAPVEIARAPIIKLGGSLCIVLPKFFRLQEHAELGDSVVFHRAGNEKAPTVSVKKQESDEVKR